MFEQESGLGSAGRGDRLALLRLYEEMGDQEKQKLLRFAIVLARRDGAETHSMS